MTFHINKPSVDRNGTEKVQIAQLISYLERLTNDLKYHLNHLDQSNFTEEMNQKLKKGGVPLGEEEHL